MSGFLKTTVSRKFAMGISGLFLVLYLALHVLINFFSTISPEIYNELSEFMGYNLVVQLLLQPVLVIGVIFHFVMAFKLEIDNKKARPINYVKYKNKQVKYVKGENNVTWMSQNMIYTGGVILLFLALHMYDFFFPEIGHKFGTGYDSAVAHDFYQEVWVKFQDPIRLVLYVVAFVFLMLHLLHGFYGSFQSVGWGDKRSAALKGFAKWYSIIVPVLFIYIALFHFFVKLNY